MSILTSNSTSTGTPVWTCNDSLQPDTTAAFGLGAVYYASSTTNSITAIDFQTGAQLWSNPSQGIPWQSPVFSPLTPAGAPGGALYATDDFGNLYSFDLVSGATDWQIEVSDSALSDPILAPQYSSQPNVPPAVAIYAADNANVYVTAADGSTTATFYASPEAIDPDSTPVFDNTSFQLIIAEGAPNDEGVVSGLSAIQLAGSPGTRSWNTDCFPTNPPVVAGGYIYVCAANVDDAHSVLMMLDVNTGAVVAQSVQLSGAVVFPVAVQNNNTSVQVLVSTDNGFLYCLNGTPPPSGSTGAPIPELWSTQPMGDQVSGPLVTAPVLSNGLVYVGGSDQNMYGLPLSGNGEDAIVQSAGSAIVCIAGVSNGNVYFATEDGIQSVNFQSVANCFQVQCDFIQDFADTPGSTTMVAMFHAHVSLFNTSSSGYVSALPCEVIKVTASQATTITVNSTQTYNIDPDTPATVMADASGNLVLTIPANTTSTTGLTQNCGFCCPMLTLWGNFMLQNERIVVYPDQPLHEKMSTISGPALQNSTGYGSTPTATGTAILPATYQGAAGSTGATNSQNLASAINNAIGQTQQSVAALLTTSSPYLGPGGSSPGVGYSSTPPSSSTRPVVSLPLLFMPNPDNPNEMQFSDDLPTIQAWMQQQEQKFGTDDSFWGDLEDFVSDVVTAVVHTVTSVAVAVDNEFNSIVTAVVNGVEKAYKFTLQAAEDAANLVMGVLTSIANAIVNAVESVIQALSFLFAWGDILNTHTAIIEMVAAMVNSLNDNLNTFLQPNSQGVTYLQALINDLSGSITGAFGNSGVSGATSQTVGAQNHSPTTAYSQGGSSSVSCTSFSQKTSNNVSGSSGSSPSLAAAVALDSTGFIVNTTAAFETFLGTLSSSLADDLANAVTSIFNTITDPGAFQSNSIGALLTQDLQNLAQNLVIAAGQAANAFLDFVKTMTTNLLDFLQQDIEIPLISDLYTWMTGDSLSPLDLVALLVAIPFTIIYKAINGTAPVPSNPTDTPNPFHFTPEQCQQGFTYSTIIYSIFDALGDLPKVPYAGLVYPLAITLSFQSLCFFAGTFADDALFPATDDSAHNIGYLVASLVPWALSIYGVGGYLNGDTTQVNAANAMLTFCGVGFLAMNIGYAAAYPQTYLYDNGTPPGIGSLTSNFFGCISELVKALPKGPGGIGGPAEYKPAFDLIGDIGCGVMNITNWPGPNTVK